MKLNVIIVVLVLVALAALLLPSLRRPHLLICLYAVASPITWTMGDPSTTIIGRFAVADVAGFAFLGVALAHVILNRRELKFSMQTMAAALLVALLLLGMWVSRVPMQSLTEVLVLGFLVVIFFAWENVRLGEKELRTILHWWIVGTTVICLLGMVDYLHFVIGTPQLFERVERLEYAATATATFRNTGQAGAYVMIVLFVALAYWAARGGFRWSKLWVPLAMSAMALFLALTVKRSAIVGTLVGVACWGALMFVRQPRHVGILLLWSVPLVAGLIFFLSSPQVTERVMWKLQTFSRVVDAEESGFMYQNWSYAVSSFVDNPFLGRGYGGTDYVTDRHEVHSTYLKMLGEGGALGFLGYLVFMGTVLWCFRRSAFSGSVWQRFLANLAPLLVGALVTWFNVYHLRKREFWIMLLIIVVAAQFAQKEETPPAPELLPVSPKPTP
jgi:O-antigen ligase